MKNLGYYNGVYDEIDKLQVPFNDRVHWFGDGVYDATYSRNHRIFALDEHVDRIYNSAALLDIHIPCTKQEMKQLLCDMVKKVDDGDQFVYWQVTRGTQMRNHSFDPDMKGNLWIVLQPKKIKDMSVHLHVMTMEDTRFLHCNIKTLNLLPSVMAAQKAESLGLDETIFHRGNIVTECAHSNVHILKDGKLITHPTDHQILPGIARSHIVRMCHRLEIGVDERPFTLEEMFAADEVIITSSGSFCMAVDTIDGKPTGGKDKRHLTLLQDALLQEFLSETE